MKDQKKQVVECTCFFSGDFFCFKTRSECFFEKKINIYPFNSVIRNSL